MLRFISFKCNSTNDAINRRKPVYTIFADCSKCGCRFRLDGCRIKSEINKETTEVENGIEIKIVQTFSYESIYNAGLKSDIEA